MTKITQADRDAAAEAFFCKPLLNEKHNDDRRVRAFARHRQYGYDQGYYDGRQADGAEERANGRIAALEADKAKMRKTLEQIAYGGAGVPYGYFGEPLRAYQLQRLAIAALQETSETFTHPDNV